MSTVKDVSKIVIQSSSGPISNLKLQKLLYYVQGWSLALYDKPAFVERIEAWVHGPVVPEIFYAYRHFRWNPIELGSETVAIPDSEVSHVKEVLKVYGSLTATDLESLSHGETPWIVARDGYGPNEPANAVISHESMKTYFKSRLVA